MKQTTNIRLTSLLIGLLSLTSASASAAGTAPVRGRLAQFVERQRQKAVTLPGVWTGARQQKSVCRAPRAVSDGPSATIKAGSEWGLLEGTDGQDWYYSIDRTAEGYYYTGATLSVYDPTHTLAGTVKIAVPDGKKVNDITPFGTITTKMFDKDASTQEITVSMHAVGDASNGYKGTYYTYVYTLAGDSLRCYEGSGVLIHYAKDAWSSYTRLLLVNDYTETSDSVDEDGLPVSVDYERVDVLKPPSWGSSEPTVEHTFTYSLDNTYYSEGSPFNFMLVDGQGYYTLAMYEKPYVSGYDSSTYDPIFTEDNHYTIRTYDESFSLVDSIAVPIVTPSDTYARMVQFGSFPQANLSRNYFTTDGQLAYVVTWLDYITSKDDYRYAFDVYDSKGEYVKTICDSVYNTFFTLAPIEGQSDQVAFMQEVGDEQQVQMVDIPSCEKKTLLPSDVEGWTISTDINRMKHGDSYQYVVKMLNGTTDDDGNVIARVAWYNPDLTVDHYTTFNLGPDAENFRINLEDNVLDPYLFNTDDGLEYIYIAKIKRSDNKIDDVVVLADSVGQTIRTFTNDAEKGYLYSAYVMTGNPLKPELAVIYQNDTTGVSTIDFYGLPLSKFAQGGDGTPAHPYVIATIGDLQQVANEPSASYVLGADLDFSGYGKAWTPIADFTGTLDGAGHDIARLNVRATGAEAGLFGSMGEGARVSDLTLTAPTVHVGEATQYAGVLAGECVSDTITGVHVRSAVLTDDGTGASATVGGLVGQAALYSHVGTSSFDGTIATPGCSPVGGIAGDIRTSTDVAATAVSGTLTASGPLGGIVGSTGTSSGVADSHCSASLTARNTVGGIVGDNGSRGPVTRCYSTSTVTATSPSWSGLAAGGIVGSLASDWSDSSTPVVSHCVFAGSLHSDATDADALASLHRIAGWTIANETYESGDTRHTEHGLADNYAPAATLVGTAAVTSTDATGVEGADKELTAMDTAFLTAQGYAFGADESSPWKATDSLPVLFFETGDAPTAIGRTETVAARPVISAAKGLLTASGARYLSVYTASGQLVARTSGDRLATASLAGGMYLVVATLADGTRTSAKVIVR